MGQWFAALRSQEMFPFHSSIAFQLDGKLNTSALESALNKIIDRHEALRTTFPDPQSLSTADQDQIIRKFGKPVMLESGLFAQTIHPSSAIRLPVLETANSDETEQIAIEEMKRPFEYSKPPLMRAVLLREQTKRHFLIAVIHHLLFDGWSRGVFFRELKELYGRYSAGRAVETRIDGAVDYVDFSSWQRSQWRDKLFDSKLECWKRQWSEYGNKQLKCNDLPFAEIKSLRESFNVGFESCTCDPQLSRSVRAFARQHHVTPYMLCLTAIDILFFGCTGKTKFAIRGLSANRTQAELENIIGWLSNESILGIEIQPSESAFKLLGQVRNAVLDAQAIQEIPMGLLWGSLLLEHQGKYSEELSNQPITFDLVLDHESGPAIMSDGVTIKPAALPLIPRPTGVDFLVSDTNDRFSISARYGSKSLTPPTVRALIGSLIQILSQLVSFPSDPVSAFVAATITLESSD